MLPTHSAEKEAPRFHFISAYARLLSLETAKSPRLLPAELKPEMRLEIRVSTQLLREYEHEVTLELSVTARDSHDLLYAMKLCQSGCFRLEGIEEESQSFYLNTLCANLLYPYACHNANTLSVQAGFPAVNLIPIDFAQLYQQKQASKKDAVDQTISEATTCQNESSVASEPSSPNHKWQNFVDNPNSVN